MYIGMRSFIPEEDRAYFEAFLIEHSLPVDQSDRSIPAKPHAPPTNQSATEQRPPVTTSSPVGEGGGRGRRGRSNRGNRGVTDVDQFLADIDSHAEAMMETSNF